MAIHFTDIASPKPDVAQIAAEHRTIHEKLAAATSDADRLAALQQWDALRRRVETWTALTELRFNQDTRNVSYKAEREYSDAIRPKLTELDVALKRKLVQSDDRKSLEEYLGRQCFALWESEITTYDPAIEDDMVREASLGAEYIELTAKAKIEFQGQAHTLSEITKYREEADRDLRYAAEQARSNWFTENREQLDRIFDDLVKLRTAMARKLGFENFVELGYKRMNRVDYDQHDVQRYRNTVHDEITPLAAALRVQQARKLGLDKVKFWDQGIHDPQGNPKPLGDHDWMIERAKQMFAAIGGGLDEFFEIMVDSGLLDLKSREGKAGGGFCTSFPSAGVPFIFANFNGTKGDVEVFTHEIGHAFQCYLSRNQILMDYLWPTYESCEIHSMGLEFLTWPQMELFFGDAAERFRRIHLANGLILFLPYGVCVDHFQHLVYAKPDATPAERHGMWQEV